MSDPFKVTALAVAIVVGVAAAIKTGALEAAPRLLPSLPRRQRFGSARVRSRARRGARVPVPGWSGN